MEYLAEQMPYSQEAEQSVLGAILLEPSCIGTVMEYVRADAFYKEANREIYSIMIRMFSSAQPIDIVTVLNIVIRESVFSSEQDARLYLMQLAQIVPAVSNVAEYAKIIREKYYVRSLISAGREIVESASEGVSDARTLLDFAEQKIFDIRQGRDSTGLTRIDEIIIQTYDQLQKLSGEDKDDYKGISSGFKALDNIITGLNRSDLILIAARPAMGKTALALNMMANVAVRSRKTVAMFSLEMSKEQLAQRLLSSEALIQGSILRTGNLAPEEWVKLAMSAQVLSNAPIYIDDTAGITVAEMKSKLRRVKDLGLVVIDYLQLMSSGRRNENRVQEISEITRHLKIMAKELNVPVITLSQLSRGPDSRAEHRPVLSDLRESGSIEQDADIVMFIYRDAYYNTDSEEHNVAECIVAKNRHGETDTIKIGWDGPHTKFTSLELFRHEA